MTKKENTKQTEASVEETYVVVKDFKDLEDNNHIYKKDHQYPRNNKKADPERVKALSTTDNKRKEVLIKVKGE